MRTLTWAPGSISVVDYIVREKTLSLSAMTRLVYVALFSRMGEDNTCFPSVPTIAAGMGASEKTVQRHVQHLEAAHLIERSNTQGGRLSTRYRLFPPWLVTAVTGDNLAPVTEQHPSETDGAGAPRRHSSGVGGAPEVTHVSEPFREPNSIQEEEANFSESAKEVWAVAVHAVAGQASRGAAEVIRQCIVEGMDGSVLTVTLPRVTDDQERVKRYADVLRYELRRTLGHPVELSLVSPV